MKKEDWGSAFPPQAQKQVRSEGGAPGIGRAFPGPKSGTWGTQELCFPTLSTIRLWKGWGTQELNIPTSAAMGLRQIWGTQQWCGYKRSKS
jgi:hypothetical protein